MWTKYSTLEGKTLLSAIRLCNKDKGFLRRHEPRSANPCESEGCLESN